MSNHILHIEARSVYGEVRYYPVTHAGCIMQLTGKKTLSESDMAALEQMGFELLIESYNYAKRASCALNIN
jgi:hypothetical protein